MISTIGVERLYLGMSHANAMEVLKSAAAAQGFEISEVLSFELFVHRRMGLCLDRKITLVQMQQPAMMLGSALLNDTLPLLLPLRMILREVGDCGCILHFPRWDVLRDSESSPAQHCMDVVYTEAIRRIAQTLRDSRSTQDRVLSPQIVDMPESASATSIVAGTADRPDRPPSVPRTCC